MVQVALNGTNSEMASVEALQGRLLSELSGLEAALSKTADPAKRGSIMARIAYLKEVLSKLTFMAGRGVRQLRRNKDQNCWWLLVLALYARGMAAEAERHARQTRAARLDFNARMKKAEELRLAA